MAVRITSAESIRRAILADALLREIFEKVEVNTSGLAPIAMGPSIGILGIASIDGFEAEWKLNIIGLTASETKQVTTALEQLFPGAAFVFQGEQVIAKIFSLVTKDVLDSVEQQKKIKADEARAKKLETAIDYASKLQSGTDGEKGERGERGERGEIGPPGPAGRDGRDIVATEAELNDIKDVYVPDPKVGTVLTWDGANWVALFVPQSYKYAGGGGSGGGGISEAPNDGGSYVRSNGQWISLDGGDFDS